MTALHPHQLRRPGRDAPALEPRRRRSFDRRLLHGATLGRPAWAPHVNALRGPHQVVVRDLRGHGHPTGPSALDAAVGDAVALLDQLPAWRLRRGGLSLGANIAQEVVRRWPAWRTRWW
jgi:pimeloyl-ACP methyl ester carboxylesterase